jgi:hypothetical protein
MGLELSFLTPDSFGKVCSLLELVFHKYVTHAVGMQLLTCKFCASIPYGVRGFLLKSCITVGEVIYRLLLYL